MEKLVIGNKKASYNYEFIDNYTAGIVLIGSEIKSIRSNSANFVDGYCAFIDGELWLKGLHISEYKIKNLFGVKYDEKRPRKLLLTKKELVKLEAKVKQNGCTIIPTKLFVNETGLIKINISLAKGKKSFDKKDSIKAKDIDRDVKRELKNK